MIKSINWIKVLIINLIIIFALLGMILLAPPVVVGAYKVIGAYKILPDTNKSSLELYSNYDWAEKFFKEFNQIRSKYYDYVTWRFSDYNGDTINIINGLRRSDNSININNQIKNYWFFGGSTTWGYGVNDEYTYPSLFARATNNQVINFGGPGYIARQSLAYFNNYLVRNEVRDMSNTHVVFYDGVNDIAQRCRSEIKGLGTGRQDRLRTQLRTKSSEPFTYERTFGQVKDFLNAIIRIFRSEVSIQDSKKMYSCSSNNERAQEIANTLVNTWQVASDLARSRGGKFTAILQPVAYYSDANVGYLKLNSSNDKSMSEQYKAVYPLIIEAANIRNIEFIDLTKIYDDCNNCYIDFCHVGPQGHHILTSRLVYELIN